MDKRKPITTELTNPMNLLDYCRRAIGEWQSLDPSQNRLLNVEYGVKKIRKHLAVDQISIDDPRTSVVDFCDAPKAFIDSISATAVTMADLYRCPGPENLGYEDGVKMVGGEGNNPIRMSAMSTQGDSNIGELVDLSNFTDMKLGINLLDRMWMTEVANMSLLEKMSLKDKEGIYWALKFRNRGCSIVPAIIEGIPFLREMGFDSWLLPNGTRVPLEALKLRVLEVVPKHLYLFRIIRLFQVGGTIAGNVLIPKFAQDTARDLNIFIRRFHPELGPTVSHVVAEVELGDDGKAYIVDPTSLQFNYRGPNRSIIAHGEWDDYVMNFPGQVLRKVEMPKYDQLSSIWDEQYLQGNGPREYITRLKANLIAYWGKDICRYCGRVEGEHPVVPRAELRYNLVPLKLLFCVRCKEAKYCGKACQVMDWKEHKGHCNVNANVNV